MTPTVFKAKTDNHRVVNFHTAAILIDGVIYAEERQKNKKVILPVVGSTWAYLHISVHKRWTLLCRSIHSQSVQTFCLSTIWTIPVFLLSMEDSSNGRENQNLRVGWNTGIQRGDLLTEIEFFGWNTFVRIIVAPDDVLRPNWNNYHW